VTLAKVLSRDRIRTMAKKRRKQQFADQLRRAIERGPATRYALSRHTGIPESVLSRFVNGKSGISLSSINLICDALDLELVSRDRPGIKKTNKRRST